MKKITFLFFIISCFAFSVKNEMPLNDKLNKPKIFIDNFTKEVEDGALINCRKFKNMGVIAYLNEDIQKYDNFQIELHRFGENEDMMVAYQNFIPSSKEFKKKVDNKDSLKLSMVNPMEVGNSDFATNTLLFKVEKITIENIVCSIHELEHVNFYVVIKGYYKTGKTNRFGEEEFDAGVEVSERSITFRNWEKK